MGPLAQPVEHRTFNPQVPSSSLGRPTIATVAQLVEQLICNQPVGGSSPLGGSIIFNSRNYLGGGGIGRRARLFPGCRELKLCTG